MVYPYETMRPTYTIEMNKLSLYMTGVVVVVVVRVAQSRHLYYLRSSFASACLPACVSGTGELHRRRNGLRSRHKLNLTQCQLTARFLHATADAFLFANNKLLLRYIQGVS